MSKYYGCNYNIKNVIKKTILIFYYTSVIALGFLAKPHPSKSSECFKENFYHDVDAIIEVAE